MGLSVFFTGAGTFPFRLGSPQAKQHPSQKKMRYIAILVPGKRDGLYRSMQRIVVMEPKRGNSEPFAQPSTINKRNLIPIEKIEFQRLQEEVFRWHEAAASASFSCYPPCVTAQPVVPLLLKRWLLRPGGLPGDPGRPDHPFIPVASSRPLPNWQDAWTAGSVRGPRHQFTVVKDPPWSPPRPAGLWYILTEQSGQR
jgi:hypothetical protein